MRLIMLSAQHTLEECPAWASERRVLVAKIWQRQVWREVASFCETSYLQDKDMLDLDSDRYSSNDGLKTVKALADLDYTRLLRKRNVCRDNEFDLKNLYQLNWPQLYSLCRNRADDCRADWRLERGAPLTAAGARFDVVWRAEGYALGPSLKKCTRLMLHGRALKTGRRCVQMAAALEAAGLGAEENCSGIGVVGLVGGGDASRSDIGVLSRIKVLVTLFSLNLLVRYTVQCSFHFFRAALCSRGKTKNVRKIYVLGGQRCIGLGEKLARTRINTKYEEYKVSSLIKPWAPSAEILNGCQNIEDLPENYMILSIGESDTNPTKITLYIAALLSVADIIKLFLDISIGGLF
ncbi:hypothetical protein HW555_006460 [Spodoptera exigua]|uniref:Uncharacterized protein n=1 Tax=Spodoptera exigua TaxID=7107 RepID=A0A835L6E3_SPOEX|nr:hypothetical protein HW555_006460 [Spodoptera exigua]